jgi:hypothetical protein
LLILALKSACMARPSGEVPKIEKNDPTAVYIIYIIYTYIHPTYITRSRYILVHTYVQMVVLGIYKINVHVVFRLVTP